MDIISVLVLVLPCLDADDLAAAVILSTGQQSEGTQKNHIVEEHLRIHVAERQHLDRCSRLLAYLFSEMTVRKKITGSKKK